MNCRICERPEPEAGPLADGVCIDCEAKLTKAPALLPAPARLDPLMLIDRAISRGIDADQLSKLMDLQERHERNEAAKAFAAAVSGFQNDCGPVFKGRKADAGKVRFDYASFDDVMRVARPHLQKYGIAVSFDTDATVQAGRVLGIVCRVRVGTHTETTRVNLPIPPTTTNDTQAFAAAVSYGKRYAMCAALNIVITDEDNDASGLEFITKADADEIIRILRKCNVYLPKFLEWAEVPIAQPGKPSFEDVRSIRARDLPKVMDMLGRRDRHFDKGAT